MYGGYILHTLPIFGFIFKGKGSPSGHMVVHVVVTAEALSPFAQVIGVYTRCDSNRARNMYGGYILHTLPIFGFIFKGKGSPSGHMVVHVVVTAEALSPFAQVIGVYTRCDSNRARKIVADAGRTLAGLHPKGFPPAES